MKIKCNTAAIARQSFSTVIKIEAKNNCKNWQIASVVCLERLPLIVPPMTDLQKRFSDFLDRTEFERSLLSEHEMRHISDMNRQNKLAGDENGIDSAVEDNIGTLMAQDFEQIALADLNTFKSAPTVTMILVQKLKEAAAGKLRKGNSDDEVKNIKSINRCLHRKLVLTVKQKLGQNSDWKLPLAILKPDETLRLLEDNHFCRH